MRDFVRLCTLGDLSSRAAVCHAAARNGSLENASASSSDAFWAMTIAESPIVRRPNSKDFPNANPQHEAEKGSGADLEVWLVSAAVVSDSMSAACEIAPLVSLADHRIQMDCLAGCLAAPDVRFPLMVDSRGQPSAVSAGRAMTIAESHLERKDAICRMASINRGQVGQFV